MQMLTINQLAELSGWPPSRIRSLIKANKLSHIRLTRLTLLPSNAIDEFIEQNLNIPK